MNEKTSIIIVHKDQSEHLELFLKTIILLSKENDYEIIVVDNDSQLDSSKQVLSKISKSNICKVVELMKPECYTSCLLEGYNNCCSDSSYLLFSHSDNVILNKNWLDFMISSEMKDPRFGGMCIGPLMEFTGPGGMPCLGPNYNFLFTTRKIFEAVNRFQYLKCENVGSILGYKQQMQDIGKEIYMINPLSFIHHFALGSISQEQKIKDVELFNQKLIKIKTN